MPASRARERERERRPRELSPLFVVNGARAQRRCTLPREECVSRCGHVSGFELSREKGLAVEGRATKEGLGDKFKAFDSLEAFVASLKTPRASQPGVAPLMTTTHVRAKDVSAVHDARRYVTFVFIFNVGRTPTPHAQAIILLVPAGKPVDAALASRAPACCGREGDPREREREREREDALSSPFDDSRHSLVPNPTCSRVSCVPAHALLAGCGRCSLRAT